MRRQRQTTAHVVQLVVATREGEAETCTHADETLAKLGASVLVRAFVYNIIYVYMYFAKAILVCSVVSTFTGVSVGAYRRGQDTQGALRVSDEGYSRIPSGYWGVLPAV